MSEALVDYEKEWAADTMSAISLFYNSSQSSSGQDEKKDIPAPENNRGSVVNSQDNRFHEIKEEGVVEENEDKNDAVAPGWAKELFRKIAKRTHPDIAKSESMLDEFRKATRAMDRKKYDKLLDIAIDLGIDPGLNQSEMIEKIETRINSSKKKIEKIENSAPWIWGESYGIDEIRSKVIVAYLNSKGIEIDNPEAVEEFVKSLSED
jgi:hypothetical protein